MNNNNTRDIDEFIELVQNEVSYCSYCQPVEGGEYIWVFGIQKNLNDLFDEIEVPEDLRDQIASRLVCPHCNNNSFEKFSDYGEKSDYEKEMDRHWQQWHEQYFDEVKDFANHLEQFPYLGLLHPIGRKIHESISSFPLTSIINQTWYRARKPIGAKVLQKKDLLPPEPQEAKAEGRFSHFGQSVLYLASDDQAALAETLDREKGEGIAWVQKYLIHDAGKIIDLRSNSAYADDPSLPIIALGLIHDHLPRFTQPNPDSAWKPEYFVPRFIADCAKQQGFDGIAFQSDKHYYVNLVLFGNFMSRVELIGDPNLIKINVNVLTSIEKDFYKDGKFDQYPRY